METSQRSAIVCVALVEPTNELGGGCGEAAGTRLDLTGVGDRRGGGAENR